MSSLTSKLEHRTWTKDVYLISTDPSLIPISNLTKIFASEDFYWGKPLPEEVMRETLHNSLCFGLYEVDRSTGVDAKDTVPEASEAALKFLGISRCITDSTTFIYLTDVYIDPSYQGKGLGTWLVSCVQEVVESMQYLRRSLCFTGDWKRSVPFYEKIMDMEVVECSKGKDGEDGKGLAVLIRKGRGHPDINTEGDV